MNIFNKLLIASVIAVVLFNPLTGSLVLLGVTTIIETLMIHGLHVIAAPVAYIVGYIAFKLFGNKPKVSKVKKLQRA